MISISERLARLPADRRAVLDGSLATNAATVTAEPIAVIGAGCRLPGGADSPAELWRLLLDGRDAVTAGPHDRWDVEAFYREGRSTTRWGGFIDDPGAFDAAAFGIAPAEAAGMDPQQRLLLEVGWEALQHAGIVPAALMGSSTGVFAGLCHSDYLLRLGGRWEELDAYAGTGNAHSVAAGRISYLLGLTGPAIAVDTACSSSLVAVHLACQSLRLRECDVALAGGASLLLSPESMLTMSAWGMFSPTGRCRSFDARADGMVRGEGAAMVVLKRLTDALRDGDRVLAVVRGSAVNQDGRSQGLTAPHPGAQQAVVWAAVDQAGVDPARVGLVETHGTGTPLGDPIEFGALAAVYGARPCALGALKSNIGHTEATAGVAGLLKAVLCLQHATVPANLHFRRWNPKIQAVGSGLFVPTASIPWPQEQGVRYAAVSSFGVSGTNAHLILEQAPAVAAAPAPGTGPVVIPLSAATPQALHATAKRISGWLRTAEPAPADVAHTLGTRRDHGPVRAVLHAGDLPGLIAELDAVTASPHRAANRPVWLFSGQGSQLTGMGRELMLHNAAFIEAVAELDPLIAAEAGFSVRDVLLKGREETSIDRVQPILFTVQVALAAVWRAMGIEPGAVIGQSMGEVAAAVVAGALTPRDGARVICRRSRLLLTIAGKGAMASVDLAHTEVECTPGTSVAVISSPGTTVVAGDPAEIEQLIAGWERRGLLARRVAADVASHSPQVDCLLDELAGLLHDLEPAMPNVPFYSTVGREEPALFGAAHWVNNLREPVQLAGAVSAAAADGFRTFLEISPHPVLTYAVAETAGDEAVVLPSLTRGQNDEEALRTQLGRLYCAGVPVDWSRLYGAGRLVDVPVRAWERTRHWIEVPFPHPHRAGAQDPSHPLLGVSLDVPGEEERRVWRTDLGTGRVPWLADHCLHDGAVLPGAGFCEMALAAASEFFAVPPTEVEVESIAFECFLALTEQTIVSTTVTSTAPGRARLEVFTQAGGHWLRHATAELGKVPPGRPERADIPALTSEHVRAVEVPAFYARLREFGYHYGPAFTGLMALRTCPSADTVLARVRVPAHARNTPGLLLHPVLLDVCLQALGAAHAANSGVDGTATPHSVGRLRIFGDTARTRLCHGIVTAHDTGSLTGIVRLLADDGTCLAEIHDVHFRSVEASVRRLDPLFHQIEWLPAPAEGRSGISDWLVLGDDQPLKEALEARLQAEGGVIGGPARSGIVVLATGSGDDGVQDALRLLQEAIGARRPARLWFVTRGACGRGDDLVPGAALRGLARVLMFEHEELSPVLVDLDPGGADPATTAGELAVELAAGRGADEVVLRGGVRHVARMVNAPPAAGPRPGPVVRADGAYVITGGLGGIGLELARWLAGLGAAHLVLNGRSAPSPLAESVLTELRGEGVRIEVVLGDLAEPGVAERLVAGAGVRGVIHAAAMVDDAVLTELTPEQVERTWRPKVTGAVRLHEATLHNDLDWFVMFSSGSAMFGSLGLGAYAAANAWLDGFAVWRRSLGLPALSIGWGPWGEAGLAVGLGDRGYATLPTRDALASLRLLLEAGTGAPASIGVFPPDPEHWFEPAPALAGSSFFAALPRAAATECEGRIRAELQQLDQVSRPPAMRNYLAARIQRVLDLDAPIDPAASLVALGFDSLSAMRLRRTLQEDLAVRVPATVVWTHPTLTVLTDHLLERTLEGP